MKYLQLLFCFVFIVIVSVIGESVHEGGQYIPKSFYTIDSHGQKSRLAYISPSRQDRLLHRFKRFPQTAGSFVSSHSSFRSIGGGPGYFQHTVAANPGFAGNTDTLVSNGAITTRTYGIGPPSGPGVITHTSGVIQPNGQVQYFTKTGHLK